MFTGIVAAVGRVTRVASQGGDIEGGVRLDIASGGLDLTDGGISLAIGRTVSPRITKNKCNTMEYKLFHVCLRVF